MPLVLDAAMNSVFSSTGSGLPSSRTPNPPANTILPRSRAPWRRREYQVPAWRFPQTLQLLNMRRIQRLRGSAGK